MSNYKTGHDAEAIAANYIKKKGFKVLALNWKTKYCEIDIVAEKSKTIYFIEVKYRKNGQWGDGIDYVTTKKLDQMKFAAEMWVNENQWLGQYQLAAISITGDQTELTEIY